MKVQFNKRNSRIVHTLYIASFIMIVATFVVVMCGALILPNIDTASTTLAASKITNLLARGKLDIFNGLVHDANGEFIINSAGNIIFPIPAHMGIWNIQLNDGKAVDSITAYLLTTSAVPAGMISALNGCFIYSLTTMGTVSIILFAVTTLLSICSFSMFLILKVKFDRHQMIAIILSYALMAVVVITFLLLKLNASDAVENPFRYVPLYQGNKTDWAGRYTQGNMSLTSFGRVCLIYSVLVGVVITGLIAMTNYDFIKMHRLSHTPNHPKYAKK